MLMPVMIQRSIGELKQQFHEVVAGFRSYLQSKTNSSNKDGLLLKDLEVCIGINKLASSTKGVGSVNQFLEIKKVYSLLYAMFF